MKDFLLTQIAAEGKFTQWTVLVHLIQNYNVYLKMEPVIVLPQNSLLQSNVSERPSFCLRAWPCALARRHARTRGSLKPDLAVALLNRALFYVSTMEPVMSDRSFFLLLITLQSSGNLVRPLFHLILDFCTLVFCNIPKWKWSLTKFVNWSASNTPTLLILKN
jgi:hypothetical protein